MKAVAPLFASLALLFSSPAHTQPAAGCTDYQFYSHWANGINAPFDDLVAGQWYLYGLNFGYLQVLDLHAPESPRGVSSTQTGGGHLALAGQSLFLVGASGPSSFMKIVSVSEPSSPMSVGSVTIPDVADEVAAQGSYAFVATNWTSPVRSSLQVVDVSNPSSPSIVGHVDLNIGTARALDVAGSYAYLALNSIVFVINIANPHQPVIAGGFNLAGDCNAIKIVGTRAYALTGTELQIIDVSNPSTPVAIGAVPVGGIDLAISGTLACVLGTDVVNVIDFSSAGLPVISATIDVQAYNSPTTIAAFGSHAYVATNRATFETGHATLHTISISPWIKPEPVASLPGVGGTVVVQGTYAYVLSDALKIVDISNPTIPTLAGSVALPYYNLGISVVGTNAFVTVANSYPPTGGQLKVVDVSSPSHPVVVGSLDIGIPLGIAAEGSYAFVGDNTGLKIVNVAIPGAPVVVQQFAFSNPHLMAFHNSRVYIYGTYNYSTPNEELSIVNVEDPEHATLVSQGDEPFGVNSVAMSGAFMYTCITHPDDVPRIYVEQIAPNDSPSYAGYVYPKNGGRLCATGGFLYLSINGGSPAHLIDISTPNRPKFIGEISPYGPNIVASGNYLFTAPGDLFVLRAPCAQEITAAGDGPASPGLAISTFPNPFNPQTRVAYEVPSARVVSLVVYDVQGRKVRTIVDHQRTTAGTHAANWDGRSDRGITVASGVYFLRLEQDGHAITKKITLLK